MENRRAIRFIFFVEKTKKDASPIPYAKKKALNYTKKRKNHPE